MLGYILCLVFLLLHPGCCQLIPGSFSGNPGTGSTPVIEGTSVAYDCEISEEVALIEIYVKIAGDKSSLARAANANSLSVKFNINRTLHHARFSCKAFWANNSEAFKSGEKWYNVLFAVTEITLTTSVSGTQHVFEEDQTIILTCTCNEGHPTPEILWTRDGDALNPDFEVPEERVEKGEFDYERVSSSLTLTTQAFMNQALYVCRVKDKEALQQDYTLQVLFLPDASELGIYPEDSVREDKLLSLTCTVSSSNPVTSIEWYLGSKLISESTSDTELSTSITETGKYHATGLQSTLQVKVTKERAGTLVECAVIYQGKQITSLAKSHTLEIREVSDVYIYAGAAAGGTMTLALIITVIIVVCHKNKRTTKKQKANHNGGPEDRYEYIIDAFSVDGDKSKNKPTPQNMEMKGQATQATQNHYIKESSSSLSYENKGKSLSSLEQLQLTTMVSEGFYATVKAGYPKEGSGIYSQQYVAAKILKGNSKPYMKEVFLSQLQAMQGLKSHENVLELLAFVNSKRHLAIVSKYYEDGNVQAFLRSRDSNCNISSRDLIGMALDVANAMKFLSSHQPPFLHHQLSGSHVLVGPRMLCKVTGFASEETVHQRENIQSKHKLDVDIRWKAPELLRHTSAHTVQSDVWSFGVLLYEISTFGSVPYPGLSPDAVKAFVLSGECMARPSFVSTHVYDVMMKCWSWQLFDRPSFAFLVTQLERLQNDPYQHIDVPQIFRPHVSEHMHAQKRWNYDNVAMQY